MNQQILKERLWDGDKQLMLTRISAEEDGRFTITLRIDKSDTSYLNSFTCRSKRIVMRCFDLINECAAHISD